MNLTIVSNLVMDTILDQDGVAIESLRGPPCYGGLTATTLGVVTNLVTRFGKNLNEEYLNYLRSRGITLSLSGVSNLPTTRYLIKAMGRYRVLTLESNCGKIRLADVEHI